MKCDKCGFEHNSRTVCPKCGTRVVYVNEDYLRRKKEWEKSVKNGKNDITSLPGIMYSSRADYDKKHGKDTTVEHYEMKKEGRSKKRPGLSFAVIKSLLEDFFKEILPRKEEKEEPKGILSHTVLKNQKKYIGIGIISVLLVAASVVIIVNVVKNKDKTTLIIQSDYNIATSEGKVLIEGDGLNCAYKGEGCSIYYDDSHIYSIKGSTVSSIEAEKPAVITYSEDAKKLIYVSENQAYITDFSDSMRLDIDTKYQGFTKECMFSDDGSYFVLTLASSGKDFSLGDYALYLGDDGGSITEIANNSDAKKIIDVSDRGRVLYYSMASADYGIINSESVHMYDEEVYTVTENVSDIYYDEKESLLYYITSSEELYMFDCDTLEKNMLEYEVTAFVENHMDDNMILCKNTDGVVAVDGSESEQTVKYRGEITDLYYDEENDYLYYTEDNTLFYATADGTSDTEEIGKIRDIIYNEKSRTLLALTQKDEILRLSQKQEKYEETAEKIFLIDNYEGFGYISNGDVYAVKRFMSKPVVIGEDKDDIKAVIYSGKKFYMLNSEVMSIVSSNGKKVQKVENILDFYITK